jgi:hypothetical protein
VETCHRDRPLASRPFMVTSYLAVEGGEFLAAIPSQCLASDEANGLSCRIRVHHHRSRKTGPCHLLVVVHCEAHGMSFTLYPPGYVPYGRVPMAPVDTEGHVLLEFGELDRAGDVGDNEISEEPAWDGTIFRAARDGSQGLAWPRQGSTTVFGSWRTQGRWIAIAAECLGLTGAVPDRWPLVGPLSVPALMMRDASAAYACTKGYVARGRAVARLLAALATTGRRLLDLLLSAGFTAGRWGEVLRWDSRARVLRRVAQLARPP